MPLPFAALTALATAASAQHCETVLVTLNGEGTQGTAGFGSTRPAVSADGRFVAFVSTLQGLVPNDPMPTGALGEVYVRDVLAGTIELVNVDSNEVPANVPGTVTNVLSISADGRYVAFDSRATNLDVAYPNLAQLSRIFVRDRGLGTTRLATIAPGNFPGEGIEPSLSSDGRYMAFRSTHAYVPGDSNQAPDVFVKDLFGFSIDHVSTDSQDLGGYGISYRPDISSDGRYVAFLSTVNLGAPHGNPSVTDAFVKDRVTREIQLVSLASWGEPSNRNTTEVRIAADGNRVVFVNTATNLVIQGEISEDPDVFLRDRAAATTIRVTHPAANPFGYSDGAAGDVSISDDGRWIAFSSTASDLIVPPIEADGDIDVFASDTLNDTFEQASRAVDGTPANSASIGGTISGDGSTFAFVTDASNLTPGDGNNTQDVVEFRRDCLPPSSTPFCFGDGSGLTCPCGNSGAPGNGCASSVNAAGANLRSTGLASVTTDTFTLRGSGLTNSIVTYLQGTIAINGGQGVLFGDGLRCAGGTVVRLAAVASPGGVSRYPNPGDAPISVRGTIPAGGGVTRTYQCWYRNADTSFCTSATFNLTNGVETTWIP